MFIKTDVIENFSESLIKRDEELDVVGVTNETNVIDEENSTMLVATRISTIIVIISWYVYGKYAFFCLRGLIRHKNFNFLFPLAATLFAFINNTNDIGNYIYHQSNCYSFWVTFMFSATLNWAPISWLQAYRLALISKIYLSKFVSMIIIGMAIILSSIYCTYYFLNLSLFDYSKSDTLGCGVTNPGTWTPYVMVSDIADSVFSLASICIIVFKSINHLKELNTRNEKLNDLVGQGIIELFIIALAKITIYPLIHYTSKIPGLDVFWDVLSMIVIISAYKLVNFPYEHSDNSKKGRHNLRKNVFNFIDTSIGHNSGNGSNNASMNNAKYIKTPDSDDSKCTYINPPSYSYSGIPNNYSRSSINMNPPSYNYNGNQNNYNGNQNNYNGKF